MSEPKGRDAAWTEERGTSDEGPPPQAAMRAERHLEAPRRRAEDTALRALVREVIRDVLPKELPVTETVNLSTDEDLAVFVARLLDADAQTREDLRTGRKRFRLAAPMVPSTPLTTLSPVGYEHTASSESSGAYVASGAEGRTNLNGSAGPPALHSAGPPVRRIERGAVTERMVRDAARAGERLILGRGAVLTPLARDRARSAGVEIERER